MSKPERIQFPYFGDSVYTPLTEDELRQIDVGLVELDRKRVLEKLKDAEHKLAELEALVGKREPTE